MNVAAVVVGVIVNCLAWGAITAGIAQAKNLRTTWEWFLVGAVFSIIGVVVVVLMKPELPGAPRGMRALKCPRCNAVQNVPCEQPLVECWRCKAVHKFWVQADGFPMTDPVPVPQSEPAQPAIPTKPATPTTPRTSKVRCHHCQHVQAAPLDQQLFECEECGVTLRRAATRT